MPYSSHATQMHYVITGPNSFATTMIVALVDVYGTELFQWLPETIRAETKQDFGIDWPQNNLDRLMAGIVIITTDKFYKSLPDFIELCNILSGAPCTPGIFSPADVDDCAWGITETLLLSPPDEEEPFTEEIRAYIGKMLEMEGIIVPPDILKIGHLSEDLKLKVHSNWSDDPEMYHSIWESEKEKTDDINDLIKSRLTLLITQLADIKLTNGNTDELAKRMLTQLNAIPSGGTPL